MNPVLQLDEYFLTRLHIDWTFPSGQTQVEVRETRCSFDYDVAAHKNDPKRRMLRFTVEFEELDGSNQKIAHHIICGMIGFFSFTDATPQGKEELILRVNGINMLYGALRGLISASTGVFPGHGFNIPNIMPSEIVKDIEAKKAAQSRQQELPITKEALP